MKTASSTFRTLKIAALTLAGVALFALPAPVRAQIVAGPDLNTSQKTGDDTECSIAKNPANPQQLFAACNSAANA